MPNSLFLSFVVAISILNTGCSSQNRVSIAASPTPQQNTAFMRGGVKLSSKNHKIALTVVDYSTTEMLAAISLANDKTQPFLFSEKNISVQHFRSDKTVNAKVYSYEELRAENSNSDNSALGQIGATAASIGSSFIPFGSIAMSLGYLAYSLYDQDNTNKNRIDSLVAAQLDQLYLRQNTIEPQQEYEGIVKIGFSEELKVGDKVLFNLILDDKTEGFTFVCQ
jgi:hypothetical protein